MLSESGRCHTFDSAADGYVRGEGCGAVVLKRMEVVSLERNPVHAVIRSVGVAQDGKSTSLMAPNGMAQESLWRSTLKEAGLVGGDVDYLEAQGSGTILGDYVKMTAVAGALWGKRDRNCALIVRSVKANVGGISAGLIKALIKAVLVLQHEQAPPNPELKTLNSKIAEAVEGFPVHFSVKLEKIPSNKVNLDDSTNNLIAAVNSFGFSGTIAQAILSQAPLELTRGLPNCSFDLPLDNQHGSSANNFSSVAFLFTGQGSQYEGMGQGLYESAPAFREAMNSCEALHVAETRESLLALIYPGLVWVESAASVAPAAQPTRHDKARQGLGLNVER
jgi:acyl transferase domain-containing protein